MVRPSLLFFPVVASVACLSLTGCSTPGLKVAPQSPLAPAAAELNLAKTKLMSPDLKAGHYLRAAESSSTYLSSKDEPERELARTIYNKACAGLPDAIVESGKGQWPVGPIEVAAPGSSQESYRLLWDHGAKHRVLDPAQFTSYVPAEDVGALPVQKPILHNGLGGAVVAVRKVNLHHGKREPFATPAGYTAPTTVTLEFQKSANGKVVKLALHDTEFQDEATVLGKRQPLAENLSAPLALQNDPNSFWDGIWGMLRGERYVKMAGLYSLEQPDPNRIPIIFVHGLMSTPSVWLDTINEIESDPELRRHYQPFVYRYPTGMPIEANALGLRTQLTKLEAMEPMPQGMVLVGHSMGGLLSRMQAQTVHREIWDANFGKAADKLYSRCRQDSDLRKALCFDSDPHVSRIIFICVPHRGSNFATGSIGAIGIWLIRLPRTFVNTVTEALGDAVVSLATGKEFHVPTSIDTLSPNNPTLKALDRLPINAPYYSIIGDRGKGGDVRLSSDGVVPYWSSHLKKAKSELIVPGNHGSYALPQAKEEEKRLLHLKLKESTPTGASRQTN